jgi:Domain of unknown function (DUF4132)
VDTPGDDLAARLAALYPRFDHPPGVRLGVLRLPILDSILGELEAIAADRPLPDVVVAELTRLAELLLVEMLGAAPETVPWRGRIVELIRISDGGSLPPLAADAMDAFGEEVRAMLESDDRLRTALGRLHPLLLRATAVEPSGRWLREAGDHAASAAGPSAIEATRRVLAALVRAPIVSRPDLLLGGVRPVNQRLARGLLWFASVALPEPAETLGTVGLRMGTSGRTDAVARDVALANTCAALLGAATDAGAVAALASMRLEITNRNVLKQVERALAAQAARAGATIEDLVDDALPTFGLDARGRRVFEAPAGSATIEVNLVGGVSVTWRASDGEEMPEPSTLVETSAPGLVAEVAASVDAILAALAEERRRLDRRLGSERSWSVASWRRRYADHPLGRIAARTLIWSVDAGSGATPLLPDLEGWVTSDERAARVDDAATIRLWHPADTGAGELAAWRATLAARAITQSVRQADREVFRFHTGKGSTAADMRHAGAIVDHPRLRALLRQRGWAVPALGAWDQGDEATGWRAFDDGLRAELRYQAPDRVPTGERIERARIVAVRFIRTDAPPASPAGDVVSVPVTEVPRRVFSEALRDVSLAVVVGELPAD